MKIIIKNDNRDIVKNPNIKIIETTEASFTNQVVFIEENDVPIIKYTDTEVMYFVKNLDNLYDRKSKSEVLLDINIDNLEAIGGGNSEPVDSRPYKVYTALLSQSDTDDPVATVLENTLGGDVVWTRSRVGIYKGTLIGAFPRVKTVINPYSTEFYYLPISTGAGTVMGYINISTFTDEIVVIIVDSLFTLTEWTTLVGISKLPIEVKVYN